MYTNLIKMRRRERTHTHTQSHKNHPRNEYEHTAAAAERWKVARRLWAIYKLSTRNITCVLSKEKCFSLPFVSLILHYPLFFSVFPPSLVSFCLSSFFSSTFFFRLLFQFENRKRKLCTVFSAYKFHAGLIFCFIIVINRNFFPSPVLSMCFFYCCFFP